MISPSKLIVYRGGIVSFRLPVHWTEEYEPEGGGTFYDAARPDSGTLRLNVLSLKPPDGVNAEQATEQVFPAGTFERLASGVTLRYRVAPAEERGMPLHLHRWDVAVPVPPTSLRVVHFVYTVLASQEHDPATVAELAYVAQSVRAAEYARVPGTTNPPGPQT